MLHVYDGCQLVAAFFYVFTAAVFTMLQSSTVSYIFGLSMAAVSCTLTALAALTARSLRDACCGLGDVRSTAVAVMLRWLRAAWLH
jgi:hypothetical protein